MNNPKSHNDDCNTDNTPNPEHSLTRRQIIRLLGASSMVFVAGCGGGASVSSAGTTTTTTGTTSGTTTTGTTNSTANATLEGEIGPYFVDDSASGFFRSSILTNIDGTDTQAGTPLVLKLTIVDTEKSGAPVVGAQVDIWHCNAAGLYSDEASENTSSDSYLRGYQITDSSGQVTFTTIIPGWYQGRTTHIHLRVRSAYDEASSASDGSNTTQVFFSQTFLNTLYTTVAPYITKGTDTTTNVSDRVYTQQTEGENELTLSGSAASGYAASFTIGLPIT